MNEYSVLVIFFLKLASNHPRLQQKRERVKKYIIHHLQETRTMSTPTLTCDDARRFQQNVVDANVVIVDVDIVDVAAAKMPAP